MVKVQKLGRVTNLLLTIVLAVMRNLGKLSDIFGSSGGLVYDVILHFYLYLYTLGLKHNVAMHVND